MTEVIIQVDKDVYKKYRERSEKLGWDYPHQLVRHLLNDLSDSNDIIVTFLHPKEKK